MHWPIAFQFRLNCRLQIIASLINSSSTRFTSVFCLYLINHGTCLIIDNLYCLGGVYIRLYLKQPSFRLTNPVLFLEKLVEYWESSFSLQVPRPSKSSPAQTTASSDSKDLILGNEDFLSLLTSCVICVVKGEPSVIDHLLSWGFPKTLTELLARALAANRRGVPITCIIRLLYQLVCRVETIDMLASNSSAGSPANNSSLRGASGGNSSDIILLFTTVLDHFNLRSTSRDQLMLEVQSRSLSLPYLPRDACFIVELIKILFQCNSCKYLGYLVSSAVQAKLPIFILNYIIGASSQVSINSLCINGFV